MEILKIVETKRLNSYFPESLVIKVTWSDGTKIMEPNVKYG